MALESATYITQLVDTNPVSTDSLGQADDHLRLIKSTLQASFSGFTGAAVTVTEAQLNTIPTITATQVSLASSVSTNASDIAALEAVQPVVGHVRANGDVVGGSPAWVALGTPVTKGGTGVYTINFPTTASNGWVIQTQRSIQNDSGNICVSEVTAGNTTSVTFRFEQVTTPGEGTDRDTEFHFIATPY